MKQPKNKHNVKASYNTYQDGSARAPITNTKIIKTTAAHHSASDNVCFICRHCRKPVSPECAGTQHRNHCPQCLSSLHLDNRPGDRASRCGGVMEPIGVWVRKGGEWAIIHRCRVCGVLSSNRIAADDNAMLLMSLAVRPLSMPPFPLDVGLRHIVDEG